MAPWFTPPIVIPLGLVVMIIAVAIYHAYLHPTRSQVAVAAPTSIEANTSVKPAPRWPT